MPVFRHITIHPVEQHNLSCHRYIGIARSSFFARSSTAVVCVAAAIDRNIVHFSLAVVTRIVVVVDGVVATVLVIIAAAVVAEASRTPHVLCSNE